MFAVLLSDDRIALLLYKGQQEINGGGKEVLIPSCRTFFGLNTADGRY